MIKVMVLNLNMVSQLGTLLDLLGAITIIAGLFISTGAVFRHYQKKIRGEKLYEGYRKDLARSILLGLEFLVAGDILRTVGQINLVSVLALAGIVLIRAFLSIEFEMEISGRWPWLNSQKSPKKRKKKSKK
ncbi:MAG: DUF1622 domain-containing protein [Candidatus Saccharibacteria bacterium]